MEKFPHIEAGSYLFRFLDHRTEYFWPAIGDMLSEQALFLNSRRNFNDPYDSQPLIINDLSSHAIRHYFDEAMQNPYNPERSLGGIARILEMKANGRTHLTKKHIDNIKDGQRKNAEKILDGAGLLSFSLTAENPLLWGHYAASFAGICVVFKRGGSLSSGLSPNR
jgi:hypothetical protein